MKRTLSLMLCLAVLLGISASAFAAPDEGGFSFQYGNRWGTTIEEVRASIPEGKEVDDIVDWSSEPEIVVGLHMYDPSCFGSSNSMRYMTYLFDDDSLYAAVYYTYDSATAFDAQVALERQYGRAFISNDRSILLAGILDAAWEDTVYAGALYNILCWELKDGTTILLTEYNENYILVYYNLDYYTPGFELDGM